MKTVFLLDVNLLVALLWPEHIFHAQTKGRYGWATCPITQAGFVRIISNSKFSREALSLPEAMDLLKENISHPHHSFWPDSIGLPDATTLFSAGLIGHGAESLTPIFWDLRSIQAANLRRWTKASRICFRPRHRTHATWKQSRLLSCEITRFAHEVQQHRREDAEHQSPQRRHPQCRSNTHTRFGQRLRRFTGLAHVHHYDDPQVVVRSNGTVQQSQDRSHTRLASSAALKM